MGSDVISTLNEDRPETPAEKEKRIRWEIAMIVRAREQVAAGNVVDGDTLLAWFEAFEHDGNALFPDFDRTL